MPSSHKERRYQQTAEEFKEWLKANPDAGIKRKTAAFNSIADSNYRTTRIQKAKPKKKAVSRV